MKPVTSSIKGQLILALIAIILASNVAAFLGTILVTKTAFDHWIGQNDQATARTLADSLAQYYQKQGSWSGLQEVLHTWRNAGDWDRILRWDDDHDDDVPVVITDPQGALVFNGFHGLTRFQPFPDLLRNVRSQGVPIMVAGQPVGYLFVKSMVFKVYNPREQEFLRTLLVTVGLSFFFGLCFAVVLGWFVAARFTRPIVKLEAAFQGVASGKSRHHVPAQGHNEIARLTNHFNRMVEQLEAQEAARQNLLADVAHELRTPVSILQANLEMLMEGVYPADRARLASLYEETQLLTELIGDLRTLSDLELEIAPTTVERVPLNLVLQECCDKHQPLFAEKKTTLELTVKSRVFVATDVQRLTRVVRNVLDNALKYGEPGTRVTVDVGPAPQKRGQVRVSISDEGPGVRDEELTQIFERFYRSDRSRNRESGGRGLGLAISKQFIEVSGGAMGAQNRTPNGLTVWFEIPVA